MATIVKRATKGAPLTHDEVDANFENLNTELATKLTGLNAGGTVDDDNIINFGNGSDLQIYHNATASDAYILNNTGELYIRGDNITLGSVDPTSPTFITMDEDGAVELYFNNSKKLETTTNGVTVNGSLVVTGGFTTGSLSVSGDLDANNLTATSALTSGSVITGIITASGVITTTGLTSNGDVDVNGNLDVSGNITGTFTGAVNATTVTTTGDITSGSNVIATGSITSDSIAANGSISGGAISSTGAITSGGGINSVGDVTVTGALSVTDAEQTRVNLDVDRAGEALAFAIALG